MAAQALKSQTDPFTGISCSRRTPAAALPQRACAPARVFAAAPACARAVAPAPRSQEGRNRASMVRIECARGRTCSPSSMARRIISHVDCATGWARRWGKSKKGGRMGRGGSGAALAGSSIRLCPCVLSPFFHGLSFCPMPCRPCMARRASLGVPSVRCLLQPNFLLCPSGYDRCRQCSSPLLPVSLTIFPPRSLAQVLSLHHLGPLDYDGERVRSASLPAYPV